MRDWRSYSPNLVLIIILVMPVAYVGSYYALVKRDEGAIVIIEMEVQRAATYRFWGSFCERFFSPMETIDRNIRRQYWNQYPP